LNSGEEIAHQVAEAYALRGERHHLLQNAVAENLSAVEALRDACRQLQLGKHIFLQPVAVLVRAPGQQRAGAQLCRSQRVVETFSGDWVDQPRAVADHGPTFAADF